MYSEINGQKIENSRNKEIYFITDYRLQDIKNVVICDALVLDYTDKEGCIGYLRNIRNSLIESIYLIPVFIISENETVDDVSVSLSDGCYQGLNEQLIFEKIDFLQNRKQQLKIVEATTSELRIINKVLRYQYTRNTILNPVVNNKSHLGYEFPLISSHFRPEESIELLNFINRLAEKGMYKRAYLDSLHLCNHCYAGFLNYRTTCPKCDSFDLTIQSLIHHNDCGYIGLEKAFGNPHNMICPNCERALEELNVDYTNSSGTYSCNNCRNLFREAVTQAYCFSCKNITLKEKLIKTSIYCYELTDIGKNYIVGEVKKEREIEKTEPNISGFVSFTTFTTYMEYEIHKAKSTNSAISIGKIKIDISMNDKNRLGMRFLSLVEEIGDFIKNTSSSGDIITVGPNDVFLIISPYSSLTKLDFLLGNMQIAVQKMLSMAFPDYDISVRVKSNFVEGRTNKTELINDLIR